MHLSTARRTLSASLLLAVCMTGAAHAQQQKGIITGLVTDEVTKQPLAAAQIAVQNTATGTQSATDGRYTLTGVTPGTVTLVVNRVGSSPVTFDVRVEAGQTVVKDIALSAQPLRMQNLIATGVADPTAGTKSPLSVAHLDLSSLPVASAAASSPLASLKGKVAGLTITTAGIPGTDTTRIQLRNPISLTADVQPLLIVDGVVLLSGTLSDIEAQDIASIEVVKGAAAAALYGSRAAAGVISVRTNRGADIGQGQTRLQTRLEAGAEELGRQVPIATHHAFLVDANGQYIDYQGNPVSRLNRVPDSTGYMDNPYGAATYDHVSQMYGVGSTMIGKLQIGYNSLGTNFASTVTGTRQTGVLKVANGIEKYNMRLNVDHRIGEKVNLSLGAFVDYSYADRIAGANPYNNLLTLGPEVDLLAVNPGYDPTSRTPGYRYVSNPDALQASIINPFYDNAIRDSWKKSTDIQLSADAAYRLSSALSLTGLLGYQRSDGNTQNYISLGTVTAVNPVTGVRTVSPGQLNIQSSWQESINGELGLSFVQGIRDLTMRASARVLGSADQATGIGITGDTLRVKDSRSLAVATVVNRDAAAPYSTGLVTDRKERDYIGTVAFDYASRYVLEGLVRRDGSSAFGADSRGKTNARASAAWRMTDEAWWPFVPITLLKLRYSVGTAGTSPSPTLQYDRFSSGSAGDISRNGLGNSALLPESVVEQEMGADITLNNQYSAELTYARQSATNLIRNNVILAYSGFDTQWQNVGSLIGHSYEATFEAQWHSTQTSRWTSNLVLSRQRSKVTKWNVFGTCGTTGAAARTQNSWNCNNAVFGTQWGNSLVRSKADLLPVHQRANGADASATCTNLCDHNTLDLFDINDEGYVVAVGPGGSWEDRRWGQIVTIDKIQYRWGLPIIKSDSTGNPIFEKWGQALPAFTYGLQNTVVYRDFTFFASVTGQVGGYAYNHLEQRYMSLTQSLAAEMDQTGKPDYKKKPSTYYTQAPIGSTNTASSITQSNVNAGLSANDALVLRNFFQKDQYVKLDEVSVSYNIRQMPSVLRRLPARSGTVSLAARNLHSWTSYNSVDPDVGGTSTSDRFDDAGYPRTRTLTAAIALTF